MKVGIVGRRGTSHAAGFRSMPDCTVAAVCDLNENAANQMGEELGVEARFTSFAQMLDHVDAVLVATPMHLHAAQVVSALNSGKHVMSEVTAAISMEELWQIWDAVQSSGCTYLFAENYCYFKENMLVLELVKAGLFGELTYGEGEYVHDVKFLHHFPDGSPTWRYYHQVGKTGSTYGTHGLGPVMQWMSAQGKRDHVDTVVAMGSGIWTDPEHPHDDTTVCLCKLVSGRMVRTRLDMISNRPNAPSFYSLQGTTGAYESHRFYGDAHRIWFGENKGPGYIPHEDRPWGSMDAYADYLPETWKKIDEATRKGGHGGGDALVAQDFIKSIRGEIENPLPAEVGLHWTAVDLCSTVSVLNGSVPIKVPVFEGGRDRPLYVPKADLSTIG